MDGAIAQYLDERFSITSLRRLGWIDESGAARKEGRMLQLGEYEWPGEVPPANTTHFGLIICSFLYKFKAILLFAPPVEF